MTLNNNTFMLVTISTIITFLSLRLNRNKLFMLFTFTKLNNNMFTIKLYPTRLFPPLIFKDESDFSVFILFSYLCLFIIFFRFLFVLSKRTPNLTAPKLCRHKPVLLPLLAP